MSSVRQRLGVRDIAKLNQIGGIEAAGAYRAYSAENADRADLAEKADWAKRTELATKAIQAEDAKNSTLFAGQDKNEWLRRIGKALFREVYSGGEGQSYVNLPHHWPNNYHDDDFTWLYLVVLINGHENEKREYKCDWVVCPTLFHGGVGEDVSYSIGSLELRLFERGMNLTCSLGGWGILSVYKLVVGS